MSQLHCLWVCCRCARGSRSSAVSFFIDDVSGLSLLRFWGAGATITSAVELANLDQVRINIHGAGDPWYGLHGGCVTAAHR